MDPRESDLVAQLRQLRNDVRTLQDRSFNPKVSLPPDMPWGRLPGGYSERTTADNGVGTGGVTVVSVTVSITAANRLIYVAGKFAPLLVGAGTPVAFVSIMAGGLSVDTNNAPVNGTGFQVGGTAIAYHTPAVGSVTYGLFIAASSGTLSVISGAGASRSFILVQDIGPA